MSREGLRRLAMAATPLTIATLSLGACGGSGTSDAERAEEARIEAVGKRFERIVTERNTRAFCAILAPNDRHRLGTGESDGARECLVVWGRKRNPLFRTQRVDLGLETIAVDGAYATAELENGGRLAFAKEGDRWYVHISPEGQAR